MPPHKRAPEHQHVHYKSFIVAFTRAELALSVKETAQSSPSCIDLASQEEFCMLSETTECHSRY